MATSEEKGRENYLEGHREDLGGFEHRELARCAHGVIFH